MQRLLLGRWLCREPRQPPGCGPQRLRKLLRHALLSDPIQLRGSGDLEHAGLRHHAHHAHGTAVDVTGRLAAAHRHHHPGAVHSAAGQLHPSRFSRPQLQEQRRLSLVRRRQRLVSSQASQRPLHRVDVAWELDFKVSRKPLQAVELGWLTAPIFRWLSFTLCDLARVRQVDGGC